MELHTETQSNRLACLPLFASLSNVATSALVLVWDVDDHVQIGLLRVTCVHRTGLSVSANHHVRLTWRLHLDVLHLSVSASLCKHMVRLLSRIERVCLSLHHAVSLVLRLVVLWYEIERVCQSSRTMDLVSLLGCLPGLSVSASLCKHMVWLIVMD